MCNTNVVSQIPRSFSTMKTYLHKFYRRFLQLQRTCCTNLPPSIQFVSLHFPPFPSSNLVITTMPKRGIGFTVQEVDVLLSAIERFLPIGPYEWDRVLAEHESHFPEAGRTKESLKRKFTVLYKARHPTGDPDIPADVLRAKKAYKELTKKQKYQREEVPMTKNWRRTI